MESADEKKLHMYLPVKPSQEVTWASIALLSALSARDLHWCKTVGQSAEQGFRQDFELGGGETGQQQDDSSKLKACMPTRRVWEHAPRKLLNLDPLRLLLRQSGTKFQTTL